MEPARCVQKDFRGAGSEGRQARSVDDRRTDLKTHRTAASLLKKEAVPRRIGGTKGGLNSKLHVVCDGKGRPLIMSPEPGFQNVALRSLRFAPSPAVHVL